MQPIRLMKSKYLNSEMQIFYKTHTNVDMHWHEFYEITLILSGNGGQHLNGKWQPLRQGSMFLISPTDFHDIISDPTGPLESYNIVFSEEMLDKDIFPMLYTAHGYHHQLIGTEFEEIRKLFDLIVYESQEDRLGRRQLMMGTLERILIQLTRQYFRDTKPIETQNHQDPIRKSLVYLQNHFRDQLSLSGVAKEVQMSPNYFSERFSKEVGTPFQQYLQDLRLEFAKNLIKSSDLPITEICMASGFNTLSHFERAFKKKFQTTPRSLRKQ